MLWFHPSVQTRTHNSNRRRHLYHISNEICTSLCLLNWQQCLTDSVNWFETTHTKFHILSQVDIQLSSKNLQKIGGCFVTFTFRANHLTCKNIGTEHTQATSQLTESNQYGRKTGFTWSHGVHQVTRSSWLNCALRDDEAVYWISIGHYEAVAIGNWWYWVSRGHLCLYISHKGEIWSRATEALLTDWLTDGHTLWNIKILSSL